MMDNTCAGENKGALLQVPNASDAPGNENTTSVYAVDNRRLTGELDQLQSEASIFTLNREDSKVNNFIGIQNSCSERFQQEAANQHMQAQNQPNEMSQVDIPMYVKETTSTERNPDQIVSASVLCHSLKATNEIYPMGNVKDKFSGGERMHLNAPDSGMDLAKVNSGFRMFNSRLRLMPGSYFFLSYSSDVTSILSIIGGSQFRKKSERTRWNCFWDLPTSIL